MMGPGRLGIGTTTGSLRVSRMECNAFIRSQQRIKALGWIFFIIFTAYVRSASSFATFGSSTSRTKGRLASSPETGTDAQSSPSAHVQVAKPFITRQHVFDLSKKVPSPLPGRKTVDGKLQRLSFRYESNILDLTSPAEGMNQKTTGVILIHPIGVGIGRWYYDRLMESLLKEYQCASHSSDMIVVAPDLLGSGTAANPINLRDSTELEQLPLLQVQDWSSQVAQLMANLERDHHPKIIDNWCLVANGGCSPIALEVAKRSVANGRQPPSQADPTFQPHFFQRPVTNVILSSVPRLPFFLPPDDNPNSLRSRQDKLERSYRRLCGVVGRLFWWYALRRNGSFVRKFSERNLVADPANLGPDWTDNCLTTARMYGGKSRYSTFSFLAGSLQVEGCRNSLETLRGSGVQVDVIRGRDRRRNPARSWFWQKKKIPRQPGPPTTGETLQQVLERNGNRGKVLEVGGRISLAHEDAPGYAKAMLELLLPLDPQ